MLETGLSPNRQIQRATWKGGKMVSKQLRWLLLRCRIEGNMKQAVVSIDV